MAKYDPDEFFSAERMGGSFEMTLNNPLTEEEWDMLVDVDFDHTNSIEFHTKHGKIVRFVKGTNVRSNADRIRAMSDEELAEFIWGAETTGRVYGPRGKAAWLDWLRQEATE